MHDWSLGWFPTGLGLIPYQHTCINMDCIWSDACAVKCLAMFRRDTPLNWKPDGMVEKTLLRFKYLLSTQIPC
jgi:hypothetical protein